MVEYPSGSDVATPLQDWFGRPDSGWQNLTLQNSWVSDGSTPRYRRVGKVVEVKGRVISGAASSVFATLPVGYRPAVLVAHMARQQGTDGSGANVQPLLIQPTGTMAVNTLTNPWFHARFLADDAANQISAREAFPVGSDEVAPVAGFHTRFALSDSGWIDATSLLVNSWTAVNTPFYRRLGSSVMLRGRLTGGTLGATMFTLPVGFRPGLDGICEVVRNSSSTGSGTGNNGPLVVTSGGLVQAGSVLTIPNLDCSFFT